MTRAIGIDFGTTYSSIYVYNCSTHIPEGIKEGAYGEFIPTVISYKRINQTDQYYFGNRAYEKSNYVIDIKRMLGISFNSSDIEDIKDELSSKGIGIRSFRNDEGCFPRQVVQLELKDPNSRTSVWHTVEELTALFLKWLIEKVADIQINDEIKVVITIPADFSSNQRKALLKAAQKANLNTQNVTLLYEPSSAAFCFIHHSARKIFNRLLVCDFGGGTFDLSILKINETSFDVISVGGNRFLGGRDLDQKIVNWAIAKLNDRGIDTEKPKIKKQIEKKCIKAKEELSSVTGTEINIVVDDGNDDERDEILEITREDFNNECSDNISKCISSIRRFLSSSIIDIDDIDGVLLVGGSSRISIFVQKVKELFGSEKILDFNNRREAIGMGACYLAAIKCEMVSYDFIDKKNLNQRLPHSIGIQCNLLFFDPFFFKNAKIPLPPETKKYYTMVDNQESIIIRIFEGEDPIVLYNELVSEFEFKDLPKRKQGEVHFLITINIDEFGILKVNVDSPQAGKNEDFRHELDLGKIETFQLVVSQNGNAPPNSNRAQTAAQNRELRQRTAQTQLNNNSPPRSC